jgi:poly(A) polymerase
MALSRERIADELLKLLSLEDPGATVTLMIERRIFGPVLPEIESAKRLRALIAAEANAGFAPDPFRRLSALLPQDADAAEKIAARLKLSNKARKRIGLAAETDLGENRQALAYWIGTEGAQDRLLLAGRTKDAAALTDWPVPRLPISGGQLIKRGVPQGPLVAKTLQAIERQWVAAGFPQGETFQRIVAEAITNA